MRRSNITAKKLVCTIEESTKQMLDDYLSEKSESNISQFVDEAIQMAIKEKRKKMAMDAIINFPKTKAIKSSEAIVREIRNNRTEEVLRRTHNQ